MKSGNIEHEELLSPDQTQSLNSSVQGQESQTETLIDQAPMTQQVHSRLEEAPDEHFDLGGHEQTGEQQTGSRKSQIMPVIDSTTTPRGPVFEKPSRERQSWYNSPPTLSEKMRILRRYTPSQLAQQQRINITGAAEARAILNEIQTTTEPTEQRSDDRSVMTFREVIELSTLEEEIIKPNPETEAIIDPENVKKELFGRGERYGETGRMGRTGRYTLNGVVLNPAELAAIGGEKFGGLESSAEDTIESLSNIITGLQIQRGRLDFILMQTTDPTAKLHNVEAVKTILTHVINENFGYMIEAMGAKRKWKIDKVQSLEEGLAYMLLAGGAETTIPFWNKWTQVSIGYVDTRIKMAELRRRQLLVAK